MRIARLFTAVATAAALVVAAATPSYAAEAAPIYDPLRPLRYLFMSESNIELNELASIGAVTVDSSVLDADMARPSLTVKYYVDNAGYVSGYCTYTRSSYGLEGGYGTVDFTVLGEATAAGKYRGSEIVAVGLKCDLYKPDMTITTGPTFAPGSAVVATASASSYNAVGGTICTTVWILTRTVPNGATSALTQFPTTCR